MGLRTFELQVVQRVPAQLKAGTLYVCFDCNVVVHLCACGCGNKVVLPIDPDFWSVWYDGESVSLKPSIGNYQFPCKSHYWIKRNRVEWVDEGLSKDVHLGKKTKGRNRRKSVITFLKRFWLEVSKENRDLDK